jgi:small conductance mechanosensitive channel
VAQPAFLPGVTLPTLVSLADVVGRLAQILGLDNENLLRVGGRVLGIWLLAWLGIWLVGAAARRIEKSVDDGDDSVTTMREKRGRTISQLLRSVGRIVIVAIAILLTINSFINIAPILAGAGILGLAISFGAQSVVKDVISGFFILFEDQFVVGDIIEAAGKGGVVERMTLRVVVLRDLEGTMHVIPNGEIKVVSNRTRIWSRSIVDVGVPYDEDIDRALGVVRDESVQFSSDPKWSLLLDGPVEVVGVESFGDSSVVIRSLIKTQPGSQWSAGREFRRRLKLRFDREGIDIPFPQRDVHLTVKEAADAGSIADAARAGAARE